MSSNAGLGLQPREANPAFPQWLLITGFFVGLVLAFGLILAVFISLSLILGPFLTDLKADSETVLVANLVRMKMCLLVGGITAGIALMFLGLPFFLVGFNNTMVVDSEKYAVKLLGATPGVLAILGGAALIAFCCSQQFRIDEGGQSMPGKDGKGTDQSTAGGGRGAVLRSWFFSGEESGLLKKLKDDMSAKNASKEEFIRTAGYLQTLYAALAAAIPEGPNLTQEQKQGKAEYQRLSETFGQMKAQLSRSETRVGDVAEQFIKADDGKYTIRVPKVP